MGLGGGGPESRAQGNMRIKRRAAHGFEHLDVTAGRACHAIVRDAVQEDDAREPDIGGKGGTEAGGEGAEVEKIVTMCVVEAREGGERRSGLW